MLTSYLEQGVREAESFRYFQQQVAPITDYKTLADASSRAAVAASASATAVAVTQASSHSPPPFKVLPWPCLQCPEFAIYSIYQFFKGSFLVVQRLAVIVQYFPEPVPLGSSL